MPLIVEDGTGLPAAESYISLDSLKAYAAGRGVDISGVTDEQNESALRRATTYIDGKYRKHLQSGRWASLFSGEKKNGRGQALEWPRSGAEDYEGLPISDSTVPIEVKNATAEAGYREALNPGSLSPDFVSASMVKREKVGPLETEFAVSVGADAAGSVRPVISIIDEMIAPVLVARYTLPAVFTV
ncbi:hypothetical protein 10AX3_7 [uncultured Caudovirales phage]|uniref:Putative DnaT-like domain-containing protein n=1 Tax=uncultured Caudovirales phage TaxID=2100421 RepID=A0A2H4JE38_9CAUD|nr:hypothetical protein 7AX2_8 [uncultured phage]ASN67421.1 hypothetical protein 2AX2_47 [uncultured Caudovirales phage]ASN67534.1 hypothetical protein 10AX3_7 [uncultured Caudovirales phage]ASN67591.1 hypothetical protein 8S4_2 [uncultured Caudovirales phage]ASN68185.1 hypothetical protein 7S5_61 [uncultured Caudovirales phage]